MTLPDVEDRLARLERSLKRVRAVVVLVLIVAAGLLLALVLPGGGRSEAVAIFGITALLMAAAESAAYAWRRHGVPEVVRAKKFEVVDDEGRIFVEIGETIDGGGAVVTHTGEPSSTSRASLAMTAGYHGQPSAESATRAASAGEPDAHHPRESGSPSTPADNGAADSAPNVDVRLIYRGDGVYEAKITEHPIDESHPGSGRTGGQRPHRRSR